MQPEDFLAAVFRNPVLGPLSDRLLFRTRPARCMDRRRMPDADRMECADRPCDRLRHQRLRRVLFRSRPVVGGRRPGDRCAARHVATGSASIEARNQARVHLWYPQKHGRPYPACSVRPTGSTGFSPAARMVGIQRVWTVTASMRRPDLEDVAGLMVRPNLTPNFSAEAYRTKTARWAALWPELTVVPPDAASVAVEGSRHDLRRHAQDRAGLARGGGRHVLRHAGAQGAQEDAGAAEGRRRQRW